MAQLQSGDPYELHNGHPVTCLPSGGRHAQTNASGVMTVETDPEVDEAGFDAGFTPDEHNLCAPDIAVGNVPNEPGWIAGAPPLAVEYADTGQNESTLQAKIHTLLGAGTRYVWVVRLPEPRRVDVYEPDRHYTVHPGEILNAPGVLKNPVRVEALYDPAAAREAALRNLLQRRGYRDLDAVLEQGQLALVLHQLQRVVGELPENTRHQIERLGQTGLKELASDLLDFHTLDDLTGWLDRRSH